MVIFDSMRFEPLLKLFLLQHWIVLVILISNIIFSFNSLLYNILSLFNQLIPTLLELLLPILQFLRRHNIILLRYRLIRVVRSASYRAECHLFQFLSGIHFVRKSPSAHLYLFNISERLAWGMLMRLTDIRSENYIVCFNTFNLKTSHRSVTIETVTEWLTYRRYSSLLRF